MLSAKHDSSGNTIAAEAELLPRAVRSTTISMSQTKNLLRVLSTGSQEVTQSGLCVFQQRKPEIVLDTLVCADQVDA